MDEHLNQVAIQNAFDAVAKGDIAAGFDILSDDVVFDNGPSAGPWRHLEGKEAFFTMAMQFVPFFHGTWNQDAAASTPTTRWPSPSSTRRGRRRRATASATWPCVRLPVRSRRQGQPTVDDRPGP